MDAAQFQLLLETFNKQQKHMMSEIIKTLSPKNDDTAVNFSSICPFENYDAKQEKFTCYMERFENYVAMKNVKEDEKKAQLLCVSIGSIHYNGLAAYLGPEKTIKSLQYKELVQAFIQMLVPKKSTVLSQHYFLNLYQKERQSIAEFVATLQRDLAECDFNVKCTDCDKIISISDVFLRAQFIRGLRENWLREQLLQSNITTFDDLLTKAITLESSKIDSKELTKQIMNSNLDYGTSEVQKITTSNHRSRFDGSRDKFHNRGFSQTSTSISRNRSHSPTHRNRSVSRNRTNINYQELGIENLCFRCAKSNHRVSKCRIRRHEVKCELCNKDGHVSKVCITTLMKNLKSNRGNGNRTYSTNTISNTFPENNNVQTYGVNSIESEVRICDLFEVTADSDKFFVTVFLNNIPQRFEVDSGARFSLLAEDDFKKLNLNIPLEPSSIVFRSYSDHSIQPVGKISVTATFNGKQIQDAIYIVPPGHSPLLGRSWIRGLGIELKEIDKTMNLTSLPVSIYSITTLNNVIDEFPNIFEEKVGCVPKFEVNLELRPNVKPIFTRERVVPYSLRARVEKELDSLESAGIITPIPLSDWGSPLVVIPKPDGGVRLCVDYKCGVNDRLVSANFPINRIEDVLNNLCNSRYFCKLDLFKAYLHLKVNEESSKIQTITTHRGSYTMNRLSFGIKTAPAEFNRILSQILKGLPKTEAYFDDLIVHGTTKEECLHNLRLCLRRLSEFDLHLNKSKCVFLETTIDYLGHVIQFNKICKSPEKVRAVSEMSQPTNVDELRRFLGLITYYSKFIPDFSTISYPLRCLLQKGKRYVWTRECEAAFIKLKIELCSDRVLIPFDPNLPLILTSDASPTGVAAVLSHMINGEEKPIAYASRSLTSSERNYSQLDREALAIVFGINHFYNYVFGRHFLLVTDNEPLTRIFSHNKALPQMTSARLLRYASFLSGFDYSVKFKKGKDNQNVDCLSRAPIKHKIDTHDSIGEEVNQLCTQTVFQISSEHITFQTIQIETSEDPELKQIVSDLQCTSTDSAYTLHNGVLYWQDRIVIPSNLREKVLTELHETHIGIMKMKQLARRYVYWPRIDSDIEKLVKSCEQCALIKSSPKKVALHSWDEPTENWERIHIDYAGPLEDYYFLICVDAKSKWAEIQISKEAPTTLSTIRLLNNIFVSHGYPQFLVSDNATIFHSAEMQSYCSQNGIFQKFIAPGYPATNGLAERNVQTLKTRLRTAKEDNTSMHEKVQNILLRYRATPLACGQSPSELYLNRKIRIRLDAIFPPVLSPNSIEEMKPVRSISVGERVRVRFFENNKNIWKFGEVIKKLGKLHYIVKLDESGRTLKRHINQLCATRVPKKRVTFGPVNVFDIPRIPQRRNVEDPVPPMCDVAGPLVDRPVTLPDVPVIRRSTRQRRVPARFHDYII